MLVFVASHGVERDIGARCVFRAVNQRESFVFGLPSECNHNFILQLQHFNGQTLLAHAEQFKVGDSNLGLVLAAVSVDFDAQIITCTLPMHLTLQQYGL